MPELSKQRRYQLAHPEKEKARKRRYNQNNKEKGAAQTARWREANPQKQQDIQAKQAASGYHRQRLYGITPDQFDAMLEGQNHACAICETPFAEVKRVCVDHCHSTGAIRGLLCTTCNTGIGGLKDDVQLVARALEYLKRTPTHVA